MTIRQLPWSGISESESETEAVGQALGAYLLSMGEDNAFIAMYGELGAGKTAFVRGLAAAVTPGAHICSPTYTIVNEYKTNDRRLCHFDMYRIETDDDLWSVGFYDYEDCMIAAEWCEKIGFALPEHYFRLELEKTGENTRRISISEHNERVTK